MKKLLLAVPAIFLLLACGDKKPKHNNEGYFPVVSFINSQVAHVDTSLYNIIRVDTKGDQSDTSFIPREKFRELATDFITIPDLARDEVGKRYREEKIYDEHLGRAIFTYIPESDNTALTRQEVVIVPSFGGNDKVKYIILEKEEGSGDKLVQKKLLWTVDESFQVVKLRGEEVEKMEVIWNRPDTDSLQQ